MLVNYYGYLLSFLRPFICLVLLVVLARPFSSTAASITWSTPDAISGDTDVSTNGNHGGAVTVINGTFPAVLVLERRVNDRQTKVTMTTDR